MQNDVGSDSRYHFGELPSLEVGGTTGTFTNAASSFRDVQDAVYADLAAESNRIWVVHGDDGSGLTRFLLTLRDRLGATAEYVDVERVATTPERFLESLDAHSSFAQSVLRPLDTAVRPREAFLTALRLLCNAVAPNGAPAVFLLDGAFEVRTFESFPGLRNAAHEFITALADSPNQFVMTTRFAHRAERLVKHAPARFATASIPPLSRGEVVQALSHLGHVPNDTADVIRLLTQGRPAYVRALGRAPALSERADPVAALAEQLSAGSELHARLRYTYEMRLHRARGYGALKAILDVLAEQEPITLTEIAKRLRRTPGSTKDYLSWLEDVDLVTAHKKRYRIRDPLLRLWIRLHCRPRPASMSEVAEAVRTYGSQMLGALAQIPGLETVPSAMSAPELSRPRSTESGLIEID